MQRAEALALRALVGEEQALVLAGEGRAQPVLEQARAAHDERPVAEIVERDRKALDDLGREVRVLEDLHDVRVVAPDLVDLDVLPVVDVLEMVVVDEVEERVRRRCTRFAARGCRRAASAYSLDLRMISAARSRPALLPPSLPWLRGRRDDAVHAARGSRRPVRYVLGDVDERRGRRSASGGPARRAAPICVARESVSSSSRSCWNRSSASAMSASVLPGARPLRSGSCSCRRGSISRAPTGSPAGQVLGGQREDRPPAPRQASAAPRSSGRLSSSASSSRSRAVERVRREQRLRRARRRSSTGG